MDCSCGGSGGSAGAGDAYRARLAYARGLELHWPWFVAGGNSARHLLCCLLPMAWWCVCMVGCFWAHTCAHPSYFHCHTQPHMAVSLWALGISTRPSFIQILFDVTFHISRLVSRAMSGPGCVDVFMLLLGHRQLLFRWCCSRGIAAAPPRMWPLLWLRAMYTIGLQKSEVAQECIQGSFPEILLPGPLYRGSGVTSVLTVCLQ
jgi:hypothetical protein